MFNNPSEYGQIEVSWGREKLIVPLPPPSSPLSELKSTLCTLTSIPPEHQKLITSGAVLRDDSAPISSYKLAPEEPAPSESLGGMLKSWISPPKAKLKKVVLIGDKDISKILQRETPKELQSQQIKKAKTEDDIIQSIKAIVESDAVKEWTEKAKKMVAWKTQETNNEEGDGTLGYPDEKDPLIASEVLLQALLKVDGVEVPSEFTTARKERKEAVKALQSTLDSVDWVLGKKSALGFLDVTPMKKLSKL